MSRWKEKKIRHCIWFLEVLITKSSLVNESFQKMVLWRKPAFFLVRSSFLKSFKSGHATFSHLAFCFPFWFASLKRNVDFHQVEREEVRELLSSGSLPKCLQQTGLGQLNHCLLGWVSRRLDWKQQPFLKLVPCYGIGEHIMPHRLPLHLLLKRIP